MTAARATALAVVSAPSDTFRCAKYACTLTARGCVLRQGNTYTQRIGGGAGVVRREQRVAVEFEYCGSGECEQGKSIAAALRGKTIEPPRPVNLKAQWAARRRALANPIPQPTGGGHA
jgi:hypothetical protein